MASACVLDGKGGICSDTGIAISSFNEYKLHVRGNFGVDCIVEGCRFCKGKSNYTAVIVVDVNNVLHVIVSDVELVGADARDVLKVMRAYCNANGLPITTFSCTPTREIQIKVNTFSLYPLRITEGDYVYMNVQVRPLSIRTERFMCTSFLGHRVTLTLTHRPDGYVFIPATADRLLLYGCEMKLYDISVDAHEYGTHIDLFRGETDVRGAHGIPRDISIGNRQAGKIIKVYEVIFPTYGKYRLLIYESGGFFDENTIDPLCAINLDGFLMSAASTTLHPLDYALTAYYLTGDAEVRRYMSRVASVDDPGEMINMVEAWRRLKKAPDKQMMNVDQALVSSS